MPEQDDHNNQRHRTDNRALSEDQRETGEHLQANRQNNQSTSARPHWADIVIAGLTLLILVTYITSDYFLWRQLKVTSGQLEQMKGSSAQTDRLVREMHALAENAGKQANNTEALARSAAQQAKATEGIARQALAQANATNELAHAAKRSADTAATQLEVAARPRLSGALSFTGPLVINRGTLRLNFKMTFTNSGLTPALKSYAIAETFALKRGVDPVAVRERLCKLASQGTETSPFTFTVYPSKEFVLGFSQPINKRDMDDAAQGAGYVAPAVVICVAYHPSFTDAIRGSFTT